jgi:hypothetical protein
MTQENFSDFLSSMQDGLTELREWLNGEPGTMGAIFTERFPQQAKNMSRWIEIIDASIVHVMADSITVHDFLTMMEERVDDAINFILIKIDGDMFAEARAKVFGIFDGLSSAYVFCDPLELIKKSNQLIVMLVDNLSKEYVRDSSMELSEKGRNAYEKLLSFFRKRKDGGAAICDVTPSCSSPGFLHECSTILSRKNMDLASNCFCFIDNILPSNRNFVYGLRYLYTKACSLYMRAKNAIEYQDKIKQGAYCDPAYFAGKFIAEFGNIR